MIIVYQGTSKLISKGSTASIVPAGKVVSAVTQTCNGQRVQHGEIHSVTDLQENHYFLSRIGDSGRATVCMGVDCPYMYILPKVATSRELSGPTANSEHQQSSVLSTSHFYHRTRLGQDSCLLIRRNPPILFLAHAAARTTRVSPAAQFSAPKLLPTV
jgi:hypothetical protein